MLKDSKKLSIWVSLHRSSRKHRQRPLGKPYQGQEEVKRELCVASIKNGSRPRRILFSFTAWKDSVRAVVAQRRLAGPVEWRRVLRDGQHVSLEVAGLLDVVVVLEDPGRDYRHVMCPVLQTRPVGGG